MNLSILGLVRAVERAASTGERIVLDVGEGKKLALVSLADLERLRGRSVPALDHPVEGPDLVDLTDELDEERLEAESNWESEGGAPPVPEREPPTIDVSVSIH